MNQVLLVGGVCIGSLTPGQAKHAAALQKIHLWHTKKKTSGTQDESLSACRWVSSSDIMCALDF